MLVAVDEVIEDMVLDDFRHQTGRGTSDSRDQMQQLLAGSLGLQGALDRDNQPPDALDPAQQLLAVSGGVHWVGGYPIVRGAPRNYGNLFAGARAPTPWKVPIRFGRETVKAERVVASALLTLFVLPALYARFGMETAKGKVG